MNAVTEKKCKKTAVRKVQACRVVDNYTLDW